MDWKALYWKGLELKIFDWKIMDRKELRTLMEFIIDSNKQTIFDTVVKSDIQLSEQQLRTIINAVEAKTKEGFFRIIEKTANG